MSVKKQEMRTRFKKTFPIQGKLLKASFRKVQTDDSDTEIDAHRPRCPWARRQSYIRKISNIQYMKVPSFMSGSVRGSKKPWKINSNRYKEESVWNRPTSNRHATINCFCLKMQRARINQLKKNRSQDWLKIRRNIIVGKFEGFSKGIRKITGKLSEETISMINEKIRETLVKVNENESKSESLLSLLTDSISSNHSIYYYPRTLSDKETSSKLDISDSSESYPNDTVRKEKTSDKFFGKLNMIKSSINFICKLRPSFRSAGNLTEPSTNDLITSKKRTIEQPPADYKPKSEQDTVELIPLKPG